MKGMVFTEFLEMVEAKFSADMVDDIISDSDLPNGGAYTSVGTYDHSELVHCQTAPKYLRPRWCRFLANTCLGGFMFCIPNFLPARRRPWIFWRVSKR
jgi:hypothetical protein